MHGIINPPAHGADRTLWREQLHQWRSVTRSLMAYDGSAYTVPAFDWASRAYALGFVMMFDTQFYDAESGHYRIDALLDDAIIEFGGYDAILLWHAYPKIGFDARNQFDFYRDAPGGLAGLRRVVDRCHERGVRVCLGYYPWDSGTRRESQGDAETLAELVAALDADGVFLDTMTQAMDGLREKLDAARPGVVMESEHLLPLEHITTHHASWAQGLPQRDYPGVLRNKWFERRHMQHRIKRWQVDHTEELHLAWMNGAGVVVWENVFGSDVRWSARDKAILRGMLPVQRRYGDLFSGEGWQPLVETATAQVAASLWEGDGLRLWTLCNLSDAPYTGPLFSMEVRDGEAWYDLIGGERLTPVRDAEGLAVVGRLRPRAIGAILAGRENALGADFATFLDSQRSRDTRASWDATPPVTVETPRSMPAPLPLAHVPDDMRRIPGRAFTLKVQFRLRECGFYGYGTGERPRLDLRFRNLHHAETLARPVQLAPFALDVTPVTNAQYAAFLQSSGYRPRVPAHFLAHWTDGLLPTALELHPVVYVDLDDARAYAAWAGKRLPTEAEWQHAAQGDDERLYPWGDAYDMERCNAGANGRTTPVSAFPAGASPYGCLDMCGNVWEWTESERSNGRTRFAILKGGSFYRAYGSDWYADGGPQPNAFSAKVILSWPDIDRCATVGFRCAADVVG